MKRYVSSLVALAVATIAFHAAAGVAHEKAPKPKVVRVLAKASPKKKKGGKRDETAKLAEAAARVHHAQGVDLGGGHEEPKVVRGVVAMPAGSHDKDPKPAIQRVAMKTPVAPALPAPSPAAGKAAKRSSEAPSPASAAPTAPAEGDDMADLVARIRGKKGDPAETKRPAKVCIKEPVEIVRGPEMDRVSLTTCEGAVAPLAVEHLSIAVRPGSVPRPTMPLAELAKKGGRELAQGIRRIDERLPVRLQAIVDHFSKPGSPAKISVVSGYRPMSVGSLHSSGRALDFRVEGVKNEEVVTFCKTLVDTGCGFYPNSSFVHLDVRDAGIGHVHWIDASGPGESPRYVPNWPPPQRAPVEVETASAKLEREMQSEPRDEHPAETSDEQE